MKRFTVLCVSGLAAAALLGCANFSALPISVEQSSGKTGQVHVRLDLGRVASLAKGAAINLDSLTIDLTANGEVAIHYMTPLSGNAQQIVNNTFTLGAKKQWTLTARTYAQQPNQYCPSCGGYNQTVHQGSASFNVVEGNNPEVDLSISSNYSMFLARINPIPDSATYMGLYQGNNQGNMYNLYHDTTFAKMARPATDTVKLPWDWMPVSNGGGMGGGSQDIHVIIRGIWNGQAVDLYWGTLNIPSVIAGVDAHYTFNLNWCGPANATGQQPIAITVNRIGLIIADGTPVTPK